MPPMIKEGWAQALEPGIRQWFGMAVGEIIDMIPLLYNVQTSTKSSEHLHTRGGLSPDSWDEFRKTKRIPSVDISAGYKTSITNETFMVELPIERELIEDEQYGLVRGWVEELGVGAARKRQFDAASVFNNAFSTSFLGADGDALCSDSHPRGPGKASDGDNNGTLSLSKANLSTVREAMIDFTDDKGNRAGIIPDTILVPMELEEEAWEIANSMLDPTSANNTANFHRGRWKVVAWEYLTDTNAWFTIDSIAMRRSLHWFDRIPLSVYLKGGDTSVFATYITRMRYGYGWSDWRWIYGNNPS